jgi:hypothetical protein
MQRNLLRYFTEILSRERFLSEKAEVKFVLKCSGVKPEGVLVVERELASGRFEDKHRTVQ